MVHQMMKKFSQLIILLLLFSNSSLLFAGDWIVAARQFSYPKKQDSALTRGLAQTIPEKVLDQVLQYSSREILSDEKNQRKLYELKNQRTSLFLQLSAQVQLRDALVLTVTDEKTLEKKITEAELKLAEIKAKIDQNLETQKEILNHTYVEPEKETDFLTKAFTKPENTALIENIALYKNDSSVLYEFEEKNKDLPLNSEAVEKELVSKGIKGFISGNINVYSQYITVTLELHSYPGASSLITLKEYGNLDDIDTIAFNLASELGPAITNALPAVLYIKGLSENIQVYIDNKLVSENVEKYSVPAGVHTLEFTGKEYKSAGTSYYFEGNKNYTIDVNLEKLEPKNISIKPLSPVIGSFYANGVQAQTVEEETVLSINGNSVLGQFITQDNAVTFYYIAEENLNNGQTYSVAIKDFDTGSYIEKRRRWMYTSYSVLVSSLIPAFFCQGQANSYIAAGNAGFLKTEKDIQTANGWITASNVATGVSVGCGIWFVYELIRYLYAANKVLPVEAK